MAGTPKIKRVLVTGGAGYVGSSLVPKLLSIGYQVDVLDLFIYGEDTLPAHLPDDRRNPALMAIKGDVREDIAVGAAVMGCDAVIHLACISNDPCFELDPELSRSADLGAFRPLIRAAKDAGVRRFIYASSSSVYGVKPADVDVTEDLLLQPLTDYSSCKVACEGVLHSESEPGFVTTILRPATVCGWSPRLRLDVVVNALAASAIVNREIVVHGGDQMRANLNIEDMTDLYCRLLELPDEAIDGKTWNVGCANLTVKEIAWLVQSQVGADVKIITKPVVDQRSYRISSDRIANDIGFVPKHDVADAIASLQAAFAEGKVADIEDDRYHNIRRMKRLRMK